MRKPGLLLWLIWVCFVIRGVFYSAILPIWEGYDEPFHFAYLQQLINYHKVPDTSTPFSTELVQSLHLVPLPWILSQEDVPQPVFSHEAYWRLTPTEREHLQQQIRDMPLAWQREESSEKRLSNYETQQTPLYYLVFYLPLKMMSGLSLTSRVIGLRILNILLASCFLPLGYAVAMRVLNDKNAALSLLLFIAALPELFIDLARVGNESLALVIYSAAVLLALKIVEGPANFRFVPWLGLTLSIGLLAKAYFLTALPALFVIVLWCYWRWPHERVRLLRNATLAAMILLAVAGPWYWRIHTLTGFWSGQTDEAALRSVSRWHLLTQIPHVNWVSGVVSILLPHVWFGAWSFLKFGRPVYLFFGAIILLGLAGIWRGALLHLRKQTPDNWPRVEVGKVLVLLSFYAWFWAGLMYEVLILYVHQGVSATNGWYLYSLIVPEAILLYLGLSAILPRRFRSWILPTLTGLFALLDVYGLHFLLVPYYTGVISHPLQGRVPEAGLSQLAHVGIAEFARRLDVNKPGFLVPGEIVALWILFLLATIFLVYTAFRLRSGHTSAINETVQ